MNGLYFKNVSEKKIIIGDLNITWIPNKVINFDKIEINEDSMEVLKRLIDQRWIILCDEDGNSISTALTSVSDLLEEKRKKKERLIEEKIQLVEYAARKGDDAFNPDELKNAGDVYILHNKIKLKSLLNMHGQAAKKFLKSEKWTLADLDDLKMVLRNDHRPMTVKYLRSVIWHLEHPREKEKLTQENGLD